MGVEPFLIAASLTGILAQRLVRVLCPKCKKKEKLSSLELKLVKDHRWDVTHSFEANGCCECSNLGYKGRTGIFELLSMNNNIKNLVMERAAIKKIREQAISDGMVTLKDDAIKKVQAGIISFKELLRAVELD